MIIETNIELGQEYEDALTGFRGIATGYVTYITGCDQVCLDPGMGADGKRLTSLYVDITCLRVPNRDAKRVVLPNQFSARRIPEERASAVAGGPTAWEPPH